MQTDRPRTVSPPYRIAPDLHDLHETGTYGGEHWTRHRFQANVTAQELAETYLPAFRTCVMAGNPAQVMCSYNSIAMRGGDHGYNSTPACLDGDIQNRQMRDQWGFEGSVVSDCDSLSDAHFAHLWGPGTGDGGNATPAETVVAGLKAGCDQNCGSFYTDYGPAAVEAGLLDNATVDTALQRILTTRFRLGEFDGAGANSLGLYDRLGAADVDSAAHRASALQAARESIVLLNNSLSVLPLKLGSGGGAASAGLPPSPGAIACIGPMSNITHINGGTKAGGPEMGGNNDYSPSFTVSPLDGLRAAFGTDTVQFTPGLTQGYRSNPRLIAAAVALAKAAEYTIVTVGIDGQDEGEGHDRGNTSLLGDQDLLVQSLMDAVGPARLVVVLINGGSLSPDWIKAHCPTVVEAMEGGQSGGTALGEVLAGKTAPSGILPYTMYPVAFLGQVAHEDMSMRKEPGRSYRFYTGRPLWPFGFSGSYTTWQVRWQVLLPAEVSVASLERGVDLRLDVFNTGAIDSAKALLFFVTVELDGCLGFTPPHRSLFAVSKVHVAAGESVGAVVNSSNLVGACGLCTVDNNGDAAIRPGKYSITVGDAASSMVDTMVIHAV